MATVELRISSGEKRLKLCWALLVLWAFSIGIAQIAPGSAPAMIASGITFPAVLLIVLVHGSLAYGWAGIGSFFAISYFTGFALEWSSIHMGFPFGFYRHGNSFGVKVLDVPLLVPLGYFYLGYLAWSLARLIARDRPTQMNLPTSIMTPLVATFLLTGFDVATDPLAGTVRSLYDYASPIGYFGVPFTNFLGWLFTGWVIFQLFALVEPRLHPTRVTQRRVYWLQPCLVWAILALQFQAMLMHAPSGTVAKGGRIFFISDVYTAAAVVALVTMIFAALAAVSRLLGDWHVASADDAIVDRHGVQPGD